MRDTKFGKVFAMCSLNSDEEQMLLMRLPLGEEDCVTARPSWSYKSRPIRDLRPSARTVNATEWKVHPVACDWGVYLSFDVNWLIREISKLWRSLFVDPEGAKTAFYHLQREWTIENTACAPGVHGSVVLIWPILMGMLRGSIFAMSFFN